MRPDSCVLSRTPEIDARSLACFSMLPACYPVETGGFRRLQRLAPKCPVAVSPFHEADKENVQKVLRTCKIGKLSYVAGAEIPKRSLLA